MFEGVKRAVGQIECGHCGLWLSRSVYADHQAWESRGDGSAKQYRCATCFEWFARDAFVAHALSEDARDANGRPSHPPAVPPEIRYPGPLDLASLEFVHDDCGGVETFAEVTMRSFITKLRDFGVQAHCGRCGRYVSMSRCRWKSTGETLASYFARKQRPLDFGGNPAPVGQLNAPLFRGDEPVEAHSYLRDLRASFGPGPRGTGALWRAVTAPSFGAAWAHKSSQYRQYVESVESVWQRGSVGWVAIVWGDSTLWERGTNSGSASCLATVDPYFDQRMGALQHLAWFVAEASRFEWSDPALAAATSYAYNLSDIVERVDLPSSVTAGPRVWMTDLVIDREYLSSHQITRTVLPAFIDEASGRATLIPYTRWPLGLNDWLPPPRREFELDLRR